MAAATPDRKPCAPIKSLCCGFTLYTFRAVNHGRGTPDLELIFYLLGFFLYCVEIGNIILPNRLTVVEIALWKCLSLIP